MACHSGVSLIIIIIIINVVVAVVATSQAQKDVDVNRASTTVSPVTIRHTSKVR